MEIKTILGNREHKKTIFLPLGNRGTSQFISGDRWNRYQPWDSLNVQSSLKSMFFHRLKLPKIVDGFGRLGRHFSTESVRNHKKLLVFWAL